MSETTSEVPAYLGHSTLPERRPDLIDRGLMGLEDGLEGLEAWLQRPAFELDSARLARLMAGLVSLLYKVSGVAPPSPRRSVDISNLVITASGLVILACVGFVVVS